MNYSVSLRTHQKNQVFKQIQRFPSTSGMDSNKNHKKAEAFFLPSWVLTWRSASVLVKQRWKNLEFVLQATAFCILVKPKNSVSSHFNSISTGTCRKYWGDLLSHFYQRFETPEVFWPEADFRWPPIYAVSFASVYHKICIWQDVTGQEKATSRSFAITK